MAEMRREMEAMKRKSEEELNLLQVKNEKLRLR